MTEKCVFCDQDAKLTILAEDRVQTPIGMVVIRDEEMMLCTSGKCDAYYTGYQGEARDEKVIAALREACEAMTTEALREAVQGLRLTSRRMMFRVIEAELAKREDQ